MSLTESIVEAAALEWFGELGYAVGHGPQLAPGEPEAERDSFGDVVLVGRLSEAIRRLNPAIPEEAREEALRKVLRVGTPSLIQTNRAFHRMLRDGVPVEYPRPDGSIAGDHVRLVDFEDVRANDWLAVNQFTVIEGQHNRRPDIVVFINGLPLSLIELKNAADEDATIWSAYAQLQTYKAEIPTLLQYNAALVVSDGLQARMGSITANQEWFKVWRTIDGEGDAPKTALELEVLVRGVFERQRFLDLLQHFIVFEEDPDTGALHKIIAGYHQFHAVNAAVEETVRASGMGDDGKVGDAHGKYWAGRMHGGKPGDRRSGVVWHTQGSGKSFSMLFFAARIIRHPAMENPTLVVLTDRNDLDDQLFGQFQRCADILGQTPVQAANRDNLRELLAVASGGVVFTTIHKFLPEKGEKMPALSTRRNIVVIADEAHRSQYDLIDGLARHMRDALPNASFIGFTGTPIEKTDANTRAIFGDYISIYDIQRAVADKATVPIYYESRISKLSLNAAALPKLDEEFEEITEGEELTKKEKLKTKWAALEALVGDPKRIKLVAADLVEHFERRLEAMDGKAMIVCMSRRIAVDMYNALIALRPDWASAPNDDDAVAAFCDRRTSENDEATSDGHRPPLQSKTCVVKVVMTGSAADGPDWQPHIRSKDKRRALANRFKDPKDPFRIVIVRDMWLTGFDAPCLHTMYADKPMQGHGLMQAIARVNRVFRDKPGGLVVDYLGLADQLKRALAIYTESGGQGDPTFDTAQAIAVMMEKHGVACDMLHQPAPLPDSSFYVYALLCADGSVYIGQTEDLLKRWEQHRRGTGAEWTKKNAPVRIAHFELAASREEAVAMEKEWKTGFGRKRIKRMIENGTARQAGGFNWAKWTTGKPAERLALIPAGQEHILEQDDGKKRFVQVVTELSRAFALCAASDEATAIRDDVSFFQTIQAALGKQTTNQRKTPEQIDAAIRQLVSKAIATDGQVIDVFTAAGLKQPDISILDDRFLAEVRGLKHKNVAAELLEKLLKDELKIRSKRNLVQSQLFSDKLKKTLNAYHNRAISTMEVIEELIKLAKEVQASGQRSGLTDDEWAFYDALATNDSAKQAMGDDKLKIIAAELITKVRQSVTIDWTLRESARARIKVMVKRILNKYGYPPDLQEEAVKTVLMQAELLCAEWV
jgi:type I restriction enzyme R subunit